MLEAVDSLCECARVCVRLMTVSSLRASPTQASDNRQINALAPLPLRIKVEDEAHNDEEEQVEMRGEKNSVFFKKTKQKRYRIVRSGRENTDERRKIRESINRNSREGREKC